jgi:C-terminal processing protease CtpA/Prc
MTVKRTAILIIVTFVLAGYPFTPASFSDTLYTNDGRELRGIVVEDYKDRIVMSTVDGEVTTMKSDIKQLYYDSDADNLVKLAEQSRERGDMVKAFAYYDMALRADTNSKAAKDGIIFLQGYLFRKEQVKKEDEVKKQEELERFGRTTVEEVKSPEETAKDLGKTLRSSVGISLVQREGSPVVESVRIGSPASEAGVKDGDAIVAVWGRLTGYMPLDEVLKILLEKPSIEMKCTIERKMVVHLDSGRNFISSAKDMVGASFVTQFDGLTVSEVSDGGPAADAGLMKGDIVSAIDGNPTRYLTLKRSLDLIQKTKNNYVLLNIRRVLLIWRKT